MRPLPPGWRGHRQVGSSWLALGRELGETPGSSRKPGIWPGAWCGSPSAFPGQSWGFSPSGGRSRPNRDFQRKTLHYCSIEHVVRPLTSRDPSRSKRCGGLLDPKHPQFRCSDFLRLTSGALRFWEFTVPATLDGPFLHRLPGLSGSVCTLPPSVPPSAPQLHPA